jgi:hypothetical protein
VAGSGRSLLSGGGGPDTLIGGGADDILIGGSLSYFNEGRGALVITSLNAIMAEWTSAASYNTRVSFLLGGGLNGTATLGSSTTTPDDGSADTLVHGPGSTDWYIVALTDTLSGKTAGGTQTTVS